MLNKGVFFLLMVVGLFACKTSKIPTSSTDPQNTTPLATDTISPLPEYYITSLGDTLKTLGEEVAIDIFRVLKDTVSIIGVGDIMMGTNFPKVSYLPANEGKDLWTEVSDTLRQADVTFGNLEGVILNEGGDQKKCNNPKVCYLFRSPEYMAGHLVEAGFDVVSLANNHAGDFGNVGRQNTMNTLDSVGVNYAGLLDAPLTIFSREGMKYGMIALSPNRGTLLFHNMDKVKQLVDSVDALVDILIVSFHAGAEGKDHQHVTRKREFYYGEDRGNVYDLARTMIDHGADVIFGHGPHVTRAVDLYKNRFIIYSLGNFCTYGRFNLSGVKGVAPIIKVETNSEGMFLQAQIIPTYQSGAGGPKLDINNRAIKVIQSLTKKDFPESNLLIDDSGLISYIHD